MFICTIYNTSRKALSAFKLGAHPNVLDADKARTAGVLNGLKNHRLFLLRADMYVAIHLI